MIEVGMFAHIKCGRYAEYGLLKGDIVYIAGEMMVALSAEDPYAYRKLFVAAYTEDGHVLDKKKPLSIDAVNLRPVSTGKQKSLYAQFEKDFTKGEG